jgi:hypothetical protein
MRVCVHRASIEPIPAHHPELAAAVGRATAAPGWELVSGGSGRARSCSKDVCGGAAQVCAASTGRVRGARASTSR